MLEPSGAFCFVSYFSTVLYCDYHYCETAPMVPELHFTVVTSCDIQFKPSSEATARHLAICGATNVRSFRVAIWLHIS